MDNRYTDPEVTKLWSMVWTRTAWLDIEARTLDAQRALDIVPADETGPLQQKLSEMVVGDDDLGHMELIETRTKHDVAAFLEWLRRPMGSVGRFIHFGLTSSDVVDTAQGVRFKQMYKVVLDQAVPLINQLTRLTTDTTPLIGRTHGQPAELLTMKARAYHWMALVAPAIEDLARASSRMAVCKLSGPVGTYAHNPPAVEEQVAHSLRLRVHGPGASQVASRAPLAAWANSAALVVGAIAKIAIDLRLMNLLGEARAAQAEGQVASSSMAHKANPIREEQLAGMARMARGYASMLQPLDSWLERDISSSSVERVAVPDLWHVTLHSIRLLTRILQDLRFNEDWINTGIGTTPELLVATDTLTMVKQGMGIDQARRLANTKAEMTRVPLNSVFADEAMRNYP